MSYDRIGNIAIGQYGVNTYDRGVYLATYGDPADPEDNSFTAYGTITDCDTSDELVGAAAFALEDNGSTLKPVHLSLSGIDPLGPGEFRLEHLLRDVSYYELLVVDARNANDLKPYGWDFDDSQAATPGLNLFRTDDWDESHSGSGYKFEISAQLRDGLRLGRDEPLRDAGERL